MKPSFPIVLLSAGLAACASFKPAPDRLSSLQAEVAQAQADPHISQYAPVALREAQQALAKARAAGDPAEFEHWAFVADNRVQLARAQTADQSARQERETLARRLEVEGARQSARNQGGKVFTFGEVLFETGKAQLKPGAYNRLQALAAELRQNPGEKAVIQGHTDSQGSADSNRSLSQARAEAVKQALVAAGIDAGRLTAQGMGEAFPVANNDTAAGRQQNRRVEVQVSEVPPGVAGGER